MKKILPVKHTRLLSTMPAIMGIILILLVSLTWSNSFKDGITTTKEVTFVIGTGVTIFVTAWLMFFKRTAFVFRLNYIDACVLSFLLYELLVFFIHKKTDIAIPFFSLTPACILILFLLISGWLKTKNARPGMVYMLIVISGAIHVLAGLLQYLGVTKSFHYFFPVTGMFFNPGPFAIYLAVIMVMSFTGCLYFAGLKKFRIVLFLSVLWLACGWLLIILQSRSSWIGLCSGMLFVTVLHVKKYKRGFFLIHKRKLIVVLTISIPLLCLLAVMAYRMKERSAQGRVLAWQVSMNIARRNLFTGVGPTNFPAAFFQYQHDLFERNKESVAKYGNLAGECNYAFNDLLQLTCESGFISLLLFMVLLGFIFFYGIRNFQRPSLPNSLQEDREYGYVLLPGALGAIVTILAAGAFSYPLSVLPLQLLFWLLVACISAGSSLPYWRPVTIQDIHISVIAALLMFPAILTIAAGCRRAKAFLEWQIIETKAIDASSLTKMPAQLAGLSPVLGDYGEYELTLGLMLLAGKQNTKAIVALQKAKKITNNKMVYYCLGKAFEMQGDYRAAETQYRYVATAIPFLLRPYYLMAKMYYTNKAYGPFYSNATKVIDFNPKVSNIETEKMKSEMADLMYELRRNKN